MISSRLPVGAFVALVLFGLPCRTTVKAQESHMSKVPVLDKITSSGESRQQFDGIIRSIDLESQILSVDTIKGNATEIFPVKMKVHVVTADGSKLKLAKLKPGTNVLIYYEQKGDHKTVTEIVVLAGGAEKRKAPPS